MAFLTTFPVSHFAIFFTILLPCYALGNQLWHLTKDFSFVYAYLTMSYYIKRGTKGQKLQF